MPRSLAVALTDILDAIDLAREAAGTMELRLFEGDRIRRAATERALLTISEAVRHLPDELLGRHPTMPWSEIRRIGNLLRHKYWLVDPKIIWEVVQRDLDPLHAVATSERILASPQPPREPS
jgi:uncharacterized protein with HEPN domain